MARTFSEEQSAVFTQAERLQPWRIGEDFVDLYELLGVPENAHIREIDEAITGRSAEVLQFSFARGGGGEWIATLQRHLSEFRVVLLSPQNRARYDELLASHRAGNAEESYDEFVRLLPSRASGAGCLNILVFGVGILAIRYLCA